MLLKKKKRLHNKPAEGYTVGFDIKDWMIPKLTLV